MRVWIATIVALAILFAMGVAALDTLAAMGIRFGRLGESIFMLMGLTLLLIVPVLILRGGGKTQRVSAERSAREEETLRALWDLQNRLERRIENLETILLSKTEQDQQIR